MDQPVTNPNPPLAPPPHREFDEDAYLQLYPDIARGIKSGAIESGWRHFLQHGFAEGRQWVPKPDPLAGVQQEISPRDEMFAGNATHYFDVGDSALHCIESALFATRRHRSGIRRVLDLPCGHGRVLRFLRKAFPAAELTACDLNGDGVDYCAKTFGAIPVLSCAELDAIPLSPGFDLIWCGSLLTHFPAPPCAAFVRLFQRLLAPGGILAFTTHGRPCASGLVTGKNRHNLTDRQIADLLEPYRKTGFGYVDYADQPGYGFSLSQPAFVLENFVQLPGWKLVSYHEGGWDKRQDVICLQKDF